MPSLQELCNGPFHGGDSDENFEAPVSIAPAEIGVGLQIRGLDAIDPRRIDKEAALVIATGRPEATPTFS